MVTYSLPVVDEIGGWDAPAPGRASAACTCPSYRAFVGPAPIDGLRDLSADIIFLGCDGLTVEPG